MQAIIQDQIGLTFIVCNAAAIKPSPRACLPDFPWAAQGQGVKEPAAASFPPGNMGCSEAGLMKRATALSYLIVPELQTEAEAGQLAPAADTAAGSCRTLQKGRHQPQLWPVIFQTCVAEEETSCRNSDLQSNLVEEHIEKKSPMVKSRALM